MQLSFRSETSGQKDMFSLTLTLPSLRFNVVVFLALQPIVFVYSQPGSGL